MRLESEEAARDLNTLESDLLAAVRQALGQAAALAAEHERATNAFKDRTGRLRGSIKRGERGPWAQFVSVGGRAAPHALWIDSGSRAHEITPRRRKTLRFVQNGRVRFVKRVYHPGTKATRFVQSARDVAEGAAAKFMTSGIESVIRR
jgi:hypothetical protein